MKDLFGSKSADFSPCRNYRYTLWRWWDESKPYVMFIGLNPSTADEIEDDPTIRRCVNFAKSWGYGGFCMTNLFAIRATKPKTMLAHNQPIGFDNDKWIDSIAKNAGIIIAAWGAHGGHINRDKEIMARFENLKCFEILKSGKPKHPLFVKSNKTLLDYP